MSHRSSCAHRTIVGAGSPASTRDLWTMPRRFSRRVALFMIRLPVLSSEGQSVMPSGAFGSPFEICSGHSRRRPRPARCWRRNRSRTPRPVQVAPRGNGDPSRSRGLAILRIQLRSFPARGGTSLTCSVMKGPPVPKSAQKTSTPTSVAAAIKASATIEARCFDWFALAEKIRTMTRQWSIASTMAVAHSAPGGITLRARIH